MTQEIKQYQDLVVWQEAMEMVTLIYQITKELPPTEKFILIPQMCRAAISVPANIAEGHGSKHRKVFQNHLSIARGSLMELETYILMTEKTKLLKPTQTKKVMDQIPKVSKLLSGLIRALKNPRP